MFCGVLVTLIQQDYRCTFTVPFYHVWLQFPANHTVIFTVFINSSANGAKSVCRWTSGWLLERMQQKPRVQYLTVFAVGIPFFPFFCFCFSVLHSNSISLHIIPVNKQLNDKERVAAALENPNLQEMVDSCLEPTFA